MYLLLTYAFALLVLVVFGIVGTLELSSLGGFNQPITGVVSAAYFTIVTLATIGSNIYPVTQTAQIFMILLIVLGIGVFLGAVTTITGDFMNERVEAIHGRISSAERRVVRGNTLLIGYGRTNRQLAELMHKKRQKFAILDKDATLVERLRRDGYKAFVGDATLQADLESIGLSGAKTAVIDLDNNSLIIHAVMVAKRVTTKTRLIVVIPSPEAERYLTDLGVKDIVDPAYMAAENIGGTLGQNIGI